MPVTIKTGVGGGSVTLDSGTGVLDTTLTLPNINGTVLYSDANGTSNIANITATTLTVSGNVTGNLTIAGTMTAANINVTGTLVMSSSFKRNRVINGNMLIDQRNAGASANAADSTYFLDRWKTYKSGAGTFTIQQSNTAPAGFTKSTLLTVTASSTPGAGDYYAYLQMIEGYNIADFAWGTASAQSVTVSGQIRSSVTGTYSVFLINGGTNRSYIDTVTISAANTFTPFSINVVGDTTGTWATDNSNGLFLSFDLGSGSTRTTSSGSWQAGLYQHATGSTNWIANSGATFYITGVQLEVGTKATPYEMQIYSDQLAQCQRYYTVGTAYYDGYGIAPSGATGSLNLFPVPMRTAPTLAFGTFTNLALLQAGGTRSPIYSYQFMRYANFNVTGSGAAYEQWTAQAEL
ncbi:hypothetical protein UFOVP908_155 [uncultured Caudovirales phage]|uniref:Uncharacterized protein n=1 Tax=uncultured Caudovirales phage TaxID=2100421 RepID=A0A6J5RGN7_9CAUD|nr:hypothetical protein UFOVP908_155 [uncultured Caudovirales phage]CAB4177163.1 hypothetical protein UFOVP990_214 [uncultured Caudovirales phage]CAB4181172.1 hypothetical protein UFOVP1065_12 [uncultured Caudovirales phage]CAB4190874.1 hypothetical protein UFOVP1198_214 [uncultured Caudovirales phage]CAB4211225.1 hypothetical protein UFOVP1418_206 [uncultured Caudovirales phage]